LDCLEKDVDTYLLELESSGENILYRHLVALFNVSHGLGIEKKALKKGIRGFFYEREPLETFTKGVHAIFDGELWVSRGIMTKTILKNRDRDIITEKGCNNTYTKGDGDTHHGIRRGQKRGYCR